MSDGASDDTARADPGGARRDSTRGRRRAWSPSSALLTVAVALFGLVAVALFVSQRTLANTLSLYAVEVFGVAVTLRFVESLAGAWLYAGYERLTAALGAATTGPASIARRALTSVADRASAVLAWVGAPTRGRRAVAGAWAASRGGRADGSAALAVLLSVVAGLLLVAWFGAVALVWCAVGLLVVATLRALSAGGG